MDESQAELVAKAMLEPSVKAQEERRRRRLAGAQKLAKRRKVAWFVLVGALLGAGVALFTGQRLSEGAIWGGMPAAIAGWLFVIWPRRRPAP